jgi:transcriptional regulator with XRE-family HTH domain
VERQCSGSKTEHCPLRVRAVPIRGPPVWIQGLRHDASSSSADKSGHEFARIYRAKLGLSDTTRVTENLQPRPSADATPNAFGARLASLRKHKGLSQREFAASIGVPNATYAEWEKGHRHPSVQAVTSIADQWNVATDWLLRGPGTVLLPQAKPVDWPLVARRLTSAVISTGRTIDPEDLEETMRLFSEGDQTNWEARLEDMVKGIQFGSKQRPL